jgi:hypothetical protein
VTLIGLPSPPIDHKVEILRQFDISPKKLRFGETIAKGYERAWFQGVWQQYLEASPHVSEKEGTEGTEGTEQAIPSRDVPSVRSVPSFPEGRWEGSGRALWSRYLNE